MWLVLTAALAFGAAPEDQLLREAPPYGTPSKVAWIVRYTDGAALDTPTFFQVTDAPPELREAYTRAQNNRMATGATFATAGVVIATAGLVTSAVVAYNSYDPETGNIEFYGIAITSAVVGVLVAAIGVGPLTQHSRHRKYPSMEIDEETADRLIAQYNAGPSL